MKNLPLILAVTGFFAVVVGYWYFFIYKPNTATAQADGKVSHTFTAAETFDVFAPNGTDLGGGFRGNASSNFY